MSTYGTHVYPCKIVSPARAGKMMPQSYASYASYAQQVSEADFKEPLEKKEHKV